jgi:glycosyltransferase involved in cell wall biosynthesis
MIGPGALSAARELGIATVQTVRNYRWECMKGTHYRAGAPCELCTSGRHLNGIKYSCYRGSRPQSAVLALALTRAAVDEDGSPDIFFAISRHVAERLVASGTAPHRVHVQRNAVLPPKEKPGPGRSFGFAGRLTEEKGIGLLLEAWAQSDPNTRARGLLVGGDGPLRAWVEDVARRDPSVTYLGHLAPALMTRFYASCRCVVVPSVWEEPFGRVAAEALSYGRSIIVSDRGGLADTLEAGSRAGWCVPPTAHALRAAMADAAAMPPELEQRQASAALQRHRSTFSPEAWLRDVEVGYGRALGGD